MKVIINQFDANRSFKIPKYESEGAAGMDLSASLQESVVLDRGKVTLIATNISLQIPQGYEAQIRPRSGLALKHGITVLNTPGTIDSDYRGEVKIILTNLGDAPFLINDGERIAQMVFNKIEVVELTLGEIDKTQRGINGFGHTGQ